MWQGVKPPDPDMILMIPFAGAQAMIYHLKGHKLPALGPQAAPHHPPAMATPSSNQEGLKSMGTNKPPPPLACPTETPIQAMGGLLCPLLEVICPPNNRYLWGMEVTLHRCNSSLNSLSNICNPQRLCTKVGWGAECPRPQLMDIMNNISIHFLCL